jgi:hypothetical protein
MFSPKLTTIRITFWIISLYMLRTRKILPCGNGYLKNLHWSKPWYVTLLVNIIQIFHISFPAWSISPLYNISSNNIPLENYNLYLISIFQYLRLTTITIWFWILNSSSRKFKICPNKNYHKAKYWKKKFPKLITCNQQPKLSNKVSFLIG